MPGKERKMTQVNPLINMLMKDLLANTLMVFTSLRVLICGMLFSRMDLEFMWLFVNKPGMYVLMG